MRQSITLSKNQKRKKEAVEYNTSLKKVVHLHKKEKNGYN